MSFSQSINLTSNQIDDVMRRFPSFELSYETMSHKKVSLTDYPTCLAIPYGKKAFLWFTFFHDQNVCFLMELGREKRVSTIQILSSIVPTDIALGTLLYGTICDNSKTSIGTGPNIDACNGTSVDGFIHFVIEDILFSKGIPLAKITFGEKLGFLDSLFCDFLSKTPYLNTKQLCVALPVLWHSANHPAFYLSRIPYTTHHFQYRSLNTILPHINVQTISADQYSDCLPSGPSAKLGQPQCSIAPLFIPPPLPRYDFSKPQYKQNTLFEVKADLQNDIYHLYAYGRSSERVYYGLAYIPNYNKSVFMNGLFRNIKENRNLDYIEESDDEDDFQDMRTDKYVDLAKTLLMECVFHYKFKRWVPLRVFQERGGKEGDYGRVVHISKLVSH